MVIIGHSSCRNVKKVGAGLLSQITTIFLLTLVVPVFTAHGLVS